MADNPVQENANAEVHVNIWQDQLTLMHQKLSHSPQILSQSAGRSSCCIFRVPKNLVAINGGCYEPDTVSIGPYHHGDERLSMIEEHKWRFLNGLLKRTESKGLTLVDYLRAVQLLEAEARECYSAEILIPTDEFIGMLVLDGCFVIELFRKFGDVVAFEDDDPLLSLSWVYSLIRKDLIRLENQIPFIVLNCLFDLTQMPDEKKPVLSLSNLTLKFFNNRLQRFDELVNKFQDLKGKHLLDFLRTSFIPEEYEESNQSNCTNTPEIHCISKLRSVLDSLRKRFIPEGHEEPNQSNCTNTHEIHCISKLRSVLDSLLKRFIPEGNKEPKQINWVNPHEIHCISKLRSAGIKLRARSSDSFLVVNFRHGVIEMPTITVDDFMKAFLLNCVAYEQCHRDCPRYMTAYAKLLDCLINTAKDVEHLCDENIIENRLGTNGEIARFVNKMGKEDQYFDAYKCQLSGLFEEVNNYYNKPRHVQWASFKNTYFRTPWSFISAAAALVPLILTVKQTLYTVISYVRPR